MPEHLIIKISSVRALKPYEIEVIFDDGTKKKNDLEHVLHGTVYGQLKNWELFKNVRINKEAHTIEWPNGADFDPCHTLLLGRV